MIGTALATMLGAPTASSALLRNAAQVTIACALGLYFTPATGALIVSLWWTIVLAIAWALGIGIVFAVLLHRVNRHAMPDLSFSTAYFASAAGGVSEMTLLAERHGARVELVASAHSMRVLIVTIAVPFALQFTGLHGVDVPPVVREVRWGGLAVLLVLGAAGALVARAMGRSNPWFLGALVASAGLTLGDQFLSAVPSFMSNGAQLVLGCALGTRFTAQFVRAAPRWLATVAASCVAMVLLCAGFGALLGWAAGVHPVTMVLGTAPGGITEMAITAKVLQLGVPLVTALQACRLVAVLILVEPVYLRWVSSRAGRA